jgi:hypothetical protein
MGSMRFSIRDLLWLMAVVALAATVAMERLAMRRQAASHVREREVQKQQAAMTVALKDARIRGLAEQNALLQHQLVVSLERQRQAEEAQRQPAAAPRPFPVPTIPMPLEEAPDR